MTKGDEVSDFNTITNSDCYVFSGGTTFATDKNRIGEVVRTKDAGSSVKSLKSSTGKTNYTYNCECSNKRVDKCWSKWY